MGLLWSKPNPDWEKILADLTSRIAEVEQRVSQLRKQQRSWSVWLLSYGSLLYLFYVLWIFIYPRGPPTTLAYRPLLDALGLTSGPLLIYYGRKFITWLYGRRIAYYDAKLREYRAQQRRKVEELKKATSYYKTKGLLERFELMDDELAESKGGGGPTLLLGEDKLKKGHINNNGILNGVIHPPSTSSLPIPLSPLTAPAVGLAPTSTTGPTSSPPPLTSPSVPVPTPPTWLDRLVDAIIGDDRQSRYALICQKCCAHNGLARPEEFETIQYLCPNCHHLNLPKGKIGVNVGGGSSDACVLVDDEDYKRNNEENYNGKELGHHSTRRIIGSTASTSASTSSPISAGSRLVNNDINIDPSDGDATPKQITKKSAANSSIRRRSQRRKTLSDSNTDS